MQNDHGPEFTLGDDPVGLFTQGIRPLAAGTYPYAPYRGPGHYEMATQLRAGAKPRCSYKDGENRIWFTVIESPKYGLLVLDEFETERAET